MTSTHLQRQLEEAGDVGRRLAWFCLLIGASFRGTLKRNGRFLKLPLPFECGGLFEKTKTKITKKKKKNNSHHSMGTTSWKDHETNT